jgi:phospholipid/cholesterol/gamma-HCH transport system substrate-binding protein
VLLGAVVLVGTGLAVAGVLLVGGDLWQRALAAVGLSSKAPLYVRVGFAEVRGVEVGTRVRIRGIDAGEVVQILPPADSDGDVVLRLRIKHEYRAQVLTTSTVQIVSEGMIGGKVLEVRPPKKGTRPGRPAEEDDLLRSEPSAELMDKLAQFSDVLEGVGSGKEGVGREVVGALRSSKAAADTAKVTLEKAQEAIERSKDTLASIQALTDALKALPGVRSYASPSVKDLLLRYNAERNRKCYAEGELFEPGRAELTAAGKRLLDAKVGPWMEGLKHKGSDVVVVAYADPNKPGARPAPALELTRQQAEAVVAYLKRHHGVHKMGPVSSRKVTALGMGLQPPPAPEEPPPPPARVEMLVFVPRN